MDLKDLVHILPVPLHHHFHQLHGFPHPAPSGARNHRGNQILDDRRRLTQQFHRVLLLALDLQRPLHAPVDDLISLPGRIRDDLHPLNQRHPGRVQRFPFLLCRRLVRQIPDRSRQFPDRFHVRHILFILPVPDPIISGQLNPPAPAPFHITPVQRIADLNPLGIPDRRELHQVPVPDVPDRAGADRLVAHSDVVQLQVVVPAAKLPGQILIRKPLQRLLQLPHPFPHHGPGRVHIHNHPVLITRVLTERSPILEKRRWALRHQLPLIVEVPRLGRGQRFQRPAPVPLPAPPLAVLSLTLAANQGLILYPEVQIRRILSQIPVLSQSPIPGPWELSRRAGRAVPLEDPIRTRIVP